MAFMPKLEIRFNEQQIRKEAIAAAELFHETYANRLRELDAIGADPAPLAIRALAEKWAKKFEIDVMHIIGSLTSDHIRRVDFFEAMIRDLLNQKGIVMDGTTVEIPEGTCVVPNADVDKAYKLKGALAFHHGLTLAENPYPDDVPGNREARKLWQEGWEEEAGQIRKPPQHKTAEEYADRYLHLEPTDPLEIIIRDAMADAEAKGEEKGKAAEKERILKETESHTMDTAAFGSFVKENVLRKIINGESEDRATASSVPLYSEFKATLVATEELCAAIDKVRFSREEKYLVVRVTGAFPYEFTGELCEVSYHQENGGPMMVTIGVRSRN
jgi:hypothetical protein